MRLVTPKGAVTISPNNDAELFWATVGGMGLTGVITTVTLKMLKIESTQVLVDTERFANLDACLLYTSPSPRDGLLSRMPSSA